jgi:nicotinate-nucleotide adenylyltransferase
MAISSKRQKRIGMYGGAFDPPHNAHVALAKAAIEQLGLDVLHVLPTGRAWHKQQQLSPAADRLAMASLAFGGLPKVRVDARETLRTGPTYSRDTLLELQAEYPGAQLYLIMGADQAKALTTWRHLDEICQLAIISIAQRADETGAISYSSSLQSLKNGRFNPIELPLMLESATAIRDLAAHGQNFAHLLPNPVALYIEQHRLYQ